MASGALSQSFLELARRAPAERLSTFPQREIEVVICTLAGVICAGTAQFCPPRTGLRSWISRTNRLRAVRAPQARADHGPQRSTTLARADADAAAIDAQRSLKRQRSFARQGGAAGWTVRPSAQCLPGSVYGLSRRAEPAPQEGVDRRTG